MLGLVRHPLSPNFGPTLACEKLAAHHWHKPSAETLRLAGTSDIDAANAFLPGFLSDYNLRFAVPPQNPSDAHRPVLHDPQELDWIFSLHAQRKLSKNLTLQYKNREYQLTRQGKGYRLRGAKATVCETFDSSVTLLYKGLVMPYRILGEGEPIITLDDEKSIHATVEQAKTIQLNHRANKPAPAPPWKRRITPSPSLAT